ncbi:hypothetical protein [Kribbella voronezhensis]|uniref:hypothetical protein n=1 Tax=Kribbella voronezhensis TaxID=2512212 RepID=UPI00192DA551|nr:hypothetical protein [Kribbella voronezhensis]
MGIGEGVVGEGEGASGGRHGFGQAEDSVDVRGVEGANSPGVVAGGGDAREETAAGDQLEGDQ